MPTDTWLDYLLIGVVIAGIAITGWVLVRRTRLRDGRGDRGPDRILDPGWQFYSKPTTMDEPGTVFRINDAGKRYIVHRLKVPTQVGEEASGKHQESVKASMGMLASFFGLEGVNARVAAEKTERLVFEMGDVAHEVTKDADWDPVWECYREKISYRVDYRYFVIRQCRKAREITYHLTSSQVNELGGEASLMDTVSLEGRPFESTSSDSYVLKQKFAKPMRIMFLAEEIAPISAGLAGERPELGLFPVREVLVWEEGEGS